MRRLTQNRWTLVRTVLTATTIVALSAALGAAAYDEYDREGQQNWQQQQYQSGQQRSSQDRGSWQQGQRSGTAQNRNTQLEQQVASELRQEGFGQDSQIMILATGNRVILLGTVRDQDQKQQAERTTNQISGVRQVDNRLQVNRGTARLSDSQLQQRIEQRVSSRTETGQDIQVQVRNGRVMLSGQVNDWQKMADVLEAAFAAGAQNITSQLSTSDQSQFGADQDQWGSRQGTEQYDYDQQGTAPLSRRYGRTSDYDQFDSRSQTYGQDQGRQTDRGYYPPYGYTPGQQDQSQWQDRQQQGQMGYGQQQGRQQWDQQRSQQQWDQQRQWDQPQWGQQRGLQQMSTSDLATGHRIAMQLQQELNIDKTIHVMNPQAIYIHVSQGSVKLHGAVYDNNQKQQAEQIVRSVQGVQNVQNQLQVAGQSGGYQTFGYVPGQTGQSQWQDRSRQDQMGGQSQWQRDSQQGTRYDRQQDTWRDPSGSSSWQQGQTGEQDSWQSSSRQSSTQGQSDQPWGQSQDQFGSRASSPRSGQESSQSSSRYGSTAGRQQSQTGQQQASASDQKLKQQVQQQLQKQLPEANIDVTVSQGTITLQGSVDGQSQKQKAEQIAQSIRGVQDIQNQIDVGDFPALGYTPGQDRQRQQIGQEQGSASDTVTAHRIAMQLQQQLSGGQIVHVMDPDAIYVHVSQGTVMLHGAVQDQNQKQQAEQAIRNIRGIQNVRNELTVGRQQRQPQFGQQTGQQTGQQAGQQRMSTSDQRLAQQIEQLLPSQLSDANINVTVSQGTATLRGSVQDNSQKQQAERIARSISGVQNIRNDLNIGGSGADYPALGYIPGQEGQDEQDTGTGISGDTQCVRMLKQKLTDQNLRSMVQNVYATCSQGKMALYGYVKSDQEKDQLEKLTKSIQGIKEVDNSLIVRKEGWEQKSDSELQEDVESQLWWSPFVDSDQIRVSVQNGVVTLTGRADDWDAMRAAVKNAFDGGAKRVRSQIQYSGQQRGTGGASSSRPSESSQDAGNRSSRTGSSSNTRPGSN